ncbi:hypothetical protein [Fibrella forsythiae]|uniref:IrrE N-terminal-like domain-containing protein n=1 Tax=Fibrella forsythiae TaxID=2817061 RepID=A0ABS3JB92_9BACT|nr:hypothetical protein [Fibrella forsythiae]MBO0947260.1 hypothetical protein [Fibrella forsythiae]
MGKSNKQRYEETLENLPKDDCAGHLIGGEIVSLISALKHDPVQIDKLGGAISMGSKSLFKKPDAVKNIHHLRRGILLAYLTIGGGSSNGLPLLINKIANKGQGDLKNELMKFLPVTSETWKFNTALALIKKRYGDYIEDNIFYKALLNDANRSLYVKFLDKDNFLTAYRIYSGKVPQECKATAFTTDPEPIRNYPVIHVNRHRDDNSSINATIVHELLHFLTHPLFTKVFTTDVGNNNFDEAVTEYFTRKVIEQKGISADDTVQEFILSRKGIYDGHVAGLNKLRDTIKAENTKEKRENYLKLAYFKGDQKAIALLKSIMGLK